MARYIDVEALMKELGIADDCDNCAWNGEGKCMKGEGFADACVAMEDAPTADVVERKKGEWVKMSATDGEYYACSFCGEDLPRYSMEKVTWDNLFPPLYSIDKTNFCPNCGARMGV